jgi:hypothetical protein
MSKQIIMDNDSPRARMDDPITSHEAAESTAGNLKASQAHVRDLFVVFGVMADHEVINLDAYVRSITVYKTSYSPSRLRTARRELADLGYLVDTGIYRLTPSGRRAKVWAVAS